MPRLSRRSVLALLAVMSGCGPGLRAAVPLRFDRAKGTPRDAGVWIDEEFLGPLSIVASQTVSLPVGEHRITIQKEGYFPWDRQISADREAILLQVALEPIPD